MNCVTIYEFEALVPEGTDIPSKSGVQCIPKGVFTWLEALCLQISESEGASWLRLTQRYGQRAVQVTSYVGVIRAPNGLQIEVLPKVGKAIDGGKPEARQLLIEMLSCLGRFRHIQTNRAKLAARRMPLLEIFISEFLHATEHIIKRGLRSDYTIQQDNLPVLRGKLLTAGHLRKNLFRADRFYTEHDHFVTNRPENRLIHTALCRVLLMSSSQSNQQLARELCFVFAEVPISTQIEHDIQHIRLDRGMSYYADALAWVCLILKGQSPLTGMGGQRAQSLLFPMEHVFEAFVAKHLAKQILPSLTLKTQVYSQHLMRHQEQHWFRLKPDLLIKETASNKVVLDTKWKLLYSAKGNGSDKYGLSQSDFYQLHAYGQNYLNGQGDMVLIYPKTDTFGSPLPVFDFLESTNLRLWVLPFCLRTCVLLLPEDSNLSSIFINKAAH